MPTFSYKGYDFDVAHQPTEQEFAQMSAYVDTLPPKKEKSFFDGLGTATKKSLAGAANAIESAISLPAGGLAGMMGFEDDRDKIFGQMDANRAAREQWANPEKLETSLGQDVAATALTLPVQIPAMLGQAAEKGMDLIKRGEPLSTAIPATVADAGLNALGMGPMAPAKTFLGRAAIGAAGNTSMGAASDALTQLLATQEETKKAYNPYDARRRAQEALVGGATQGAMGERPKAKGNTPRLQGALDELVAPKEADVKKAPSLEPEQLRLFDQFDERSPVSPYQTEMAPDMWRVDENGIPIRADLSMEVQNLQQPLQRNLFGDELDVNFPRNPTDTLVDSPVMRDTDLEMNSRPLTEAIDAMPEGVRNREGGKFAPGTTRQSALDLLRNELPADNELKTAALDAEIKQWIAENDQPKNDMAARFGRAKKQRGALLIGDKRVVVEASEDGFVAKVGDKVVGYLRSNLTPEQRAQLGETANVDMVKVENGFKGKGVGKALYDAWTKANEGNVAPSGKTSPDAWKLWKRDNPGAVDAFAAQEAKRIADGADEGMVLGNITDPEVREKVSSFNARTRRQGGGILFDPKDNIKKNNSDLFKAQVELENLSKSFWIDQAISKEEFHTKNQELRTKINDLERTNTKWQETLPPKRVNEIHPGYTKIPLGTDVLTTRRGELERATVVENRNSQVGDKSTWYPRVEFIDGKKSRLSPEDITKVFGTPNRPFNSKKQSGGVLFDWKGQPEMDQLKKVAGLREKLRNLIPTTMTADEAIVAAKGMKDVDQNIAQKAINVFTKGGLYQAEKTGNPIIKFVVDKMLDADRLARADIRDYIHDSLAPAMRDLSTVERTEIATVLNQADMNKVEVTPEFLQKHGFSEKQTAFAQAHKQTMDAAFERINAARAAAGKAPIDKRTAYSAMNATGDFRKRVYTLDEDGNKVVVGVLGAKTKWGLASIEKKMRASNPEYIIESETRYGAPTTTGRGGSTVVAIQQALEMLSENSPATNEFLQVLEDIKTKEAYDYRGQKSHTKGKKGVFGMEGRKPWLTAEENAKDFMDAQLQYAEAALKWGHLSDATREANKVLASDVDMPNAKKWAEGYIRNALGLNPTKAGTALEAAINSFWEATGVGHTIPSNVMGYSRKAVNTMLLGLNPAFLATNVVQPFLSMPAMTSFLKSRGIDAMTTGYDSMAKAGFTIFKDKLGKLNELEAAAKDYADKHHVYGSELVDTSTVSRKNAEFYLDKTGNFLAGNVESGTRQLMYYGFVHMLDDNGIRDFGLANNLTDMAMNNYSPIERPTIFNALGPIGDIAANLSSFKHNELSRLAMFAREIGKEGDAKPFLMQIAVGAAAAGITGSLAFAEADWLYRQITKAMGKPDSLSRVVIDFSETLSDDPKGKYVASHGVFSLMGLDLSKRLGVSDVVPNSLGEAMFPGGSKLVDVASQGLSTLSDPSEMNFKRLAREAAPGFATGAMDRNWFSQQTPQGELGLNRDTLAGQVIRTDADKMAKNFGFTGINESVQKQKLWDLKQQGIGYSELRSAVVKKMVDRLHAGQDIPQQMLENYQRYEGDADTLVRELEPKLKAGQVSAVDVAKLLAINAKSTPQKMQGARTLESLQ